MRTTSPDAAAALSAPVVRVVRFVYMAFAPTPIALNTSSWDFDYGGITYKGAYGLGSISTVDDSPGEIKGVQLELSGVSSDYIALALDDAAIVQGTPLTLRTAIINEAFEVVDAPIDWTGTLDTMSIQEDGDTCTIQVTAESSAVDLLRGAALTYSNADQQALAPGDRAFEYILSQANTPVVWPTKEWFIAKGQR